MPRIELSELLRSREERHEKQVELVQKFALPIICFTLNIPGATKRSALVDEVFRLGMQCVQAELLAGGVRVVYSEQSAGKCGMAAYFVAEFEAQQLKDICENIEESRRVGRLFDIDVIDEKGGKLSRKIARKCFLCDKPAFECSRSRVHSMEDIEAFVTTVMGDFARGEFCEFLGSCATRALLHEVAITPKPGLVDRANNGAHRDMTFFTFLDSTVALENYFLKVATLSAEFCGTPNELFLKLRHMGKMAEHAMKTATGGINTHKGAIFSLGLLCASAAHNYGINFRVDIGDILLFTQTLCRGVMDDFKNKTCQNAVTQGERLYCEHGVTGVRGVAMGGYDMVKKAALPVFKACLEGGHDMNYAGVMALVALMAENSDTNILHRGGIKGALFVKNEAQNILEKVERAPQTLYTLVSELDTVMCEQRLSAGGSADLLAVTLFLYFIKELFI